MRLRPSRSIASRYSASASSPSLSNARERACDPERPARSGDARALFELRQRRGCLVGGAGPRARLDELDERPAEEPQILVLARAPGGGERDRVLPEPVVQHRRRVLGQADRPSFSAGGRVGEGRLDQLLGLDPVAAPGRQQEGRVPERRVAGGRADRVGLLDQRVGGRELPGVDVHAGPRRERDRQDRERTGLARQRHRPAGEPVPRLVVPQVGGDRLRRDGARQPEPPHVVLGGLALLPERVERPPQRRRGGGVALGEPGRQTVEQQVDRAGRPSRRGRGAGGVGHGLHAAARRRADRRRWPLGAPRGTPRGPARD